MRNTCCFFIHFDCSDYEERSPSLAPHQPQPYPVVDLSDMLRVFANRIGEFKALLEKPKSVVRMWE